MIEETNVGGARANIDEALANPERYITVDFIEYAMKDIMMNGKNSQYHNMFLAYKRTSDQNMKDYYAYCMMMPPEYARNYVREFVQKEIRNHVGSIEDLNNEMEDGSTSLTFDDVYKPSAAVDKGMFTDLHLHDAHSNPESIVTLQDFFSKFINHPLLSRNARIVLIARMMVGDSGGKKRINNYPIPLNEFVQDLPPEYAAVTKQYEHILKQGVPADEITSKMLWNGFQHTDDSGRAIASAGALVPRSKLSSVASEAAEVIRKLSNGQADAKISADGESWDLTEVYRWINQRNVWESKSSLDMNKAIAIAKSLIGSRGRFKNSELISFLVILVHMNRIHNTSLSRRWSNLSLLEIAKQYMKLAKSTQVRDREQVLSLFVAAMKTNRKLKAKIDLMSKKLNSI